MPAGLRLLVPAAKLAHKGYKAWKKSKKVKQAGKALGVLEAADMGYGAGEYKAKEVQERKKRVRAYQKARR